MTLNDTKLRKGTLFLQTLTFLVFRGTLFPKVRIFRQKKDPFLKNKGHAKFPKTDPFSVKFRTIMRTLCLCEWRDRGGYTFHFPIGRYLAHSEKQCHAFADFA